MNTENPPFLVARYALIIAIVGGLAALLTFAAGGLGGTGVTAQEFVDLQQGGTVHAGFRRAHAKGFCVAGEFVSSGALEPHTTATLFASQTTPFVGRLSIAGSNPTAPDLKAPVRSLALSFAVGEREAWRTAMNTPPVMAVRTPEDFFLQLSALAPDRETGKRDPGKISRFFDEHPESKAFTDWASNYQPTGSLATEKYHSINAFYLVNSGGKRQAVRWQARPVARETGIRPAPGRDALHREFFRRLGQGPVKFDLVFTLAAPEDDADDPTRPWPQSRRQLVAGQLVINSATPQAGGACEGISFDPLVLPHGMEPTRDPILRARSAAYAESYRRRAREHWLGRAGEAGE
ncbi:MULTISPECIES: catalase family peroxidase [Microbulbifer]|uniref:catalase family peroxidase n=1 Tax=Microbulbifer TaxID=48073 RepID=UPI001F2D445E|nr:catalase family peroxidase [Microbulbifer zhoushanensis]